MISPELFDVLKQVVSSWQVIITAIAVIIFLSIIGAATNTASKKRKQADIKKLTKINRPPKQPALDSNVDTSELNLGE